jgi:hypothetical protein
LSALVPRRVQEAKGAKMGNAEEEPAGLPNRQTYQVYMAIDGQRTVEELAFCTHLSMEEIRASIHILLLRHRVQLYEPGGTPVDSTRYLDWR